MEKVYKILVINPGSTSTKLAVYENEKKTFDLSVNYTADEIGKYNLIKDQFEMRLAGVEAVLKENGIDTKELSAVVGRGGMLPPVKAGAYKVNKAMCDFLRERPTMEHASNLGAMIAFAIAEPLGIHSYIYDSVAIDEMIDIARISGMPEIQRQTHNHYLNSRAMAIKAAQKYGKKYNEMNFVVAHLGGGISVNVHQKGRIIDVISDEEGPFSPERAGGVPATSLFQLCYSGKYSKDEMRKKLRGNGGLKAYLNTLDAREVEKMIANGDKYAATIYEAMAYQVAKCIGQLATVVKGEVDLIILTGGIAHSKMLTSWIAERVSFIAPVEIMPGEYEMESLAFGALRVLRGKEETREFVAPD